jgi:hypothetical protein
MIDRTLGGVVGTVERSDGKPMFRRWCQIAPWNTHAACSMPPISTYAGAWNAMAWSSNLSHFEGGVFRSDTTLLSSMTECEVACKLKAGLRSSAQAQALRVFTSGLSNSAHIRRSSSFAAELTYFNLCCASYQLHMYSSLIPVE